jgi:hypothetical protein
MERNSRASSVHPTECSWNRSSRAENHRECVSGYESLMLGCYHHEEMHGMMLAAAWEDEQEMYCALPPYFGQKREREREKIYSSGGERRSIKDII